MDAIRTTCAYCGVGCGISAKVTGERSVAITGDAAHPANRGRLCSKGTHLGETVGLEGRLLHPMIGEQRVTWNSALDEVVNRMRQCIAEYGPDSVAFYVSGQLLSEDYYVANKLMKGFIGSGNIDTNSRLCMASAVAAHNRAFGEDVVPCSYDDLDEADLILLVGSNTAWCHPVIWQRIEKAREARGTRIVVIDPRRTETADMADLHISIAPDGDVALFNALLAEMRERGCVDEDYLAASVETPGDFWLGIETSSSGVSESDFAALADLVEAHPRMVTLFSQGANQSVCGTDKGNAIINLHLATGRIGVPGAGPFSITGQPNAMGGRETGGLATMLACHLGFSESERADVAAFWETDRLCTVPGLKAVDMFRAVHEGRIKFLWVMATNPAVSLPDGSFVREALARCPTVVVSDVIADTDTTRFAHVRLPALAWGEKDGTVTNSERMISRQRALFPAPGEARADWRIVCDIASRLGWGEQFDYASPAQVFGEFAAMTELAARRGKVLDLTDSAPLGEADYDAMEPFQWGGERPLRHSFPTASGKAQLVPVRPSSAVDDNADYPFSLNTGRYRDQWHTMTRTGLSPTLSRHRREPLVEANPLDGEKLGLADGSIARVSTSHGSAVYRVHLTEEQARGTLFVPMHWNDAMAGDALANHLPGQGNDPHSGQPGFKNTPASIEAVSPEWRAFLISREPVHPDVLYWVRSRIEGGWLTELAGMGSIDVAALLPSGHASEVADKARGMLRLLVQDDDGELRALLFMTRTGQLPQRDWVVRQFGDREAGISELLAGRSATPMPDRGEIVCVCHDIGEVQISEAISQGANSVAAVGKATCAGTNCGSCRPIIKKLLELQNLPVSEEVE